MDEASDAILVAACLLVTFCWLYHRRVLKRPWPGERQMPGHGIDVGAPARRLQELRDTGFDVLTHHPVSTAHQARINQAQESVGKRGYFRHHAKEDPAADEER